MKLRQYMTALLIGSSATIAFGWGQKGHDTVAFIAENHLTPDAKAAVENLLDGKSMVYYANWLDNASHTPEYEYSKTWHYKNIDDGQTFEEAPNLETGNIVEALERQIAILNNKNAPQEERTLALKMVIHLVGDIHQPMHMGHASDRGGNQWTVNFFKRPNNLHSVWDSSLPESGHKWSYSEWQQQIDRATPEQIIEITYGGTPASWGKETYEICKEVYATTPRDSNISYDYVAKWTPVIENQFLKGGLRLADVLNSIFDTEYLRQNAIVK